MTRKILALAVICMAVGSFAISARAQATDSLVSAVRVEVSGEGAIGKDKIESGVPFNMDVYASNGSKRSGFTLGFQFTGKDGLKSVVHIFDKDADSASYHLSSISAYNGFEDRSIWDLGGLQRRVDSWDGNLPDSALVGGICMNNVWGVTTEKKYFSFEMIAVGAGTLCIDSAYIPPGGAWMFAPGSNPSWEGPYCFEVVAKEKAEKAKPDSAK
ncbi:MAG: hypothetical protein IIB00_05490 [candidate division Zixibacteria bacterium]|nr:hypothetical protein [candidate division Zixibacteria bacterium]